MIKPGDLVVVSSRRYRPWRVVRHRVTKATAIDLAGELAVRQFTLCAAPRDCDEFSVLLKGLDGDQAIVTPSTDLTKSPKSAWFLTGRESLHP